ncbi:MAG TPA: helix-turn-helix transcriptional regulator [Candidatus Acidoferrales bacterium]|nr:helix-turn-helix transcriptional regulator [Candidatus Acidoferrales bacterium]
MARNANPELAAALGKAILGRRRELERSQEDIAHESDMSTRQYINIESGVGNALVGNVYAIAQALDLRFSELAERTERAMRRRR